MSASSPMEATKVTFTNPDPEYEWMVDEARAELEKLARGR